MSYRTCPIFSDSELDLIHQLVERFHTDNESSGRGNSRELDALLCKTATLSSSNAERARVHLRRITRLARNIGSIAGEMVPKSWASVADDLERVSEQLADINALFDPDFVEED